MEPSPDIDLDAAVAGPASEQLFGAFRGRPTPNKNRVYALVLGVLVFLGAVVAVLAYTSKRIDVVTPYGIRTVAPGWSPEQVSKALGRAVGIDVQSGGRECRRYAQPTVKQETVAVYTICYQDGKLVSLTEQPFGLWKFRKDGTLGPMKERPTGPVPDLWKGDPMPPPAPAADPAADPEPSP